VPYCEIKCHTAQILWDPMLEGVRRRVWRRPAAARHQQRNTCAVRLRLRSGRLWARLVREPDRSLTGPVWPPATRLKAGWVRWVTLGCAQSALLARSGPGGAQYRHVLTDTPRPGLRCEAGRLTLGLPWQPQRHHTLVHRGPAT
jgi:hypothetical protein